MNSREDFFITIISLHATVNAYEEQARALAEGGKCEFIIPLSFFMFFSLFSFSGCDIFLVETIFDTLNAKAALYAIDCYQEKTGKKYPLMISGTIVDLSGT
jgi:methionine synthase I (cobalamin-dependent)